MGLLSIFQQKSLPASGQAREVELVRKAVFHSFPMGGDAQALQSGDGEWIGLFPAFVVDFLVDCTSFRTFGEHLRKYVSYHELGAADIGSLEDWLPRLREAG